jgi:YggT family protein
MRPPSPHPFRYNPRGWAAMAMHPLLYAIMLVLDFFSFVLFVAIVLNLLLHFEVINRYNPFVSRVHDLFRSVTEPALKYVRRFVPPVGGVDLSPIVVFFAIAVAKQAILYYG